MQPDASSSVLSDFKKAADVHSLLAQIERGCSMWVQMSFRKT
jgi:hypothetical protein